jgi:hypothetical protein
MRQRLPSLLGRCCGGRRSNARTLFLQEELRVGPAAATKIEALAQQRRIGRQKKKQKTNEQEKKRVY